MKTKDRDPESYFAIIDSFLRRAELEENQYNILVGELRRYLTVKFENKGYMHPMITKFCTDWYREFYRLIGFKDPYKQLKEKSNEEAKRIFPLLHVDNFKDAVKVSVKGNKLDYGAILVLNPDLATLEEEFREVKNLEFTIDDNDKLEEEIKKANTILFLPDNAGEVIFDIPLLKYLNQHLPKLSVGIR